MKTLSIAEQIERITDSVAVQANAIDAARTLLATKTTESAPAFEDNNCRKWIFTTLTDSAAGGTISVATGDTWLSANRSDASLTIALIPLDTMTVAAKSIICAVQGNRFLWAEKYGRCMHGNSGGTGIGSNSFFTSVAGNGEPGAASMNGFAVTSAGNLTFTCRDGGSTLVLPAGRWLVVAMIDDEEEEE